MWPWEISADAGKEWSPECEAVVELVVLSGSRYPPADPMPTADTWSVGSKCMRFDQGLAGNQHAGLIFVGLLLARDAVTSAGVRNLAVEGGMVQPCSANELVHGRR